MSTCLSPCYCVLGSELWRIFHSGLFRYQPNTCYPIFPFHIGLHLVILFPEIKNSSLILRVLPPHPIQSLVADVQHLLDFFSFFSSLAFFFFLLDFGFGDAPLGDSSCLSLSWSSCLEGAASGSGLPLPLAEGSGLDFFLSPLSKESQFKASPFDAALVCVCPCALTAGTVVEEGFADPAACAFPPLLVLPFVSPAFTGAPSAEGGQSVESSGQNRGRRPL